MDGRVRVLGEGNGVRVSHGREAPCCIGRHSLMKDTM